MTLGRRRTSATTTHRILVSSGVIGGSDTIPSVLKGNNAILGRGNSPDREDSSMDEEAFTADGDVGDGPDDISP